MSDIVTRLRDAASGAVTALTSEGDLMLEAADEIERLRREVELLRKGLEFEKRIAS